jgi:hypothetical protein
MRRFFLLLLLVPGPAAAEPDPVAALESAIARWELSCRRPNDLGDCTSTRAVAVSHHCEKQMREVTNRRAGKAARAAQADIAAAIAALEKLPDAASDPRISWVGARARTAVAEAAFEDLVRLRFPTGLDFSGRNAKASRERFDAFIKAAGSRLDAALAAYQQVYRHPGATTALRLRALARRGQLSARFAEILRSAEIPRDVRTGELAADKIDAFCDALVQVIEPHEQNARTAFEECVAMGGGAGMWAAVCASP